MKNFIKRFFGLFTLKETLAMLGLGICGAIIGSENRKQGYKRGVQDCIDVTKEVIEESKNKKDAAE